MFQLRYEDRTSGMKFSGVTASLICSVSVQGWIPSITTEFEDTNTCHRNENWPSEDGHCGSIAKTVDNLIRNYSGTMCCFTGTELVLICSLLRLYSDTHIGICALCNRRLTLGVRRRQDVHTATPSLQGYSRINTEQCLQLWTGPVSFTLCTVHIVRNICCTLLVYWKKSAVQNVLAIAAKQQIRSQWSVCL